VDSGERKEKKEKKKIGIKIKDPGPKESSEQGAFCSRQERDLGIPKRKKKKIGSFGGPPTYRHSTLSSLYFGVRPFWRRVPGYWEASVRVSGLFFLFGAAHIAGKTQSQGVEGGERSGWRRVVPTLIIPGPLPLSILTPSPWITSILSRLASRSPHDGKIRQHQVRGCWDGPTFRHRHHYYQGSFSVSSILPHLLARLPTWQSIQWAHVRPSLTLHLHHS